MAGKYVAAQPMRRAIVGLHNREQKRRARMPEPKLVRIDPVPVRSLPMIQKKVDRGQRIPATAGRAAADRFTIPAAFGMWAKVQLLDDLRWSDFLPPDLERTGTGFVIAALQQD